MSVVNKEAVIAEALELFRLELFNIEDTDRFMQNLFREKYSSHVHKTALMVAEQLRSTIAILERGEVNEQVVFRAGEICEKMLVRDYIASQSGGTTEEHRAKSQKCLELAAKLEKLL